jgi:hypothetical protein
VLDEREECHQKKWLQFPKAAVLSTNGRLGISAKIFAKVWKIQNAFQNELI